MTEQHVDLAIIGLGSVGSFAMLHAAQQGLSVVGLERHGLHHDNGAYSGESRLFRVLYHEGADYLPLLMGARERWTQLDAAAERSLFLPTGVLSIADEDAPELQGVKATALAADLPHRRLSTQQLREDFPQHGNVTTEVGVLDELGGILRPESAVAEAQRLAQMAGAQVLTNTAVISLEEDPEGVNIAHSGGDITADRVVVATGAWTSLLVPELSACLTPQQLVLTWFAPDRIADFLPEVFPGFIRDTAGVHIFGVPSLDGSLVKAGVADVWEEHLTPASSPDDLHRRLTDEQLAPVGEAVHHLLPALPNRPSRHSVHMDVRTPDRRALLGNISSGIIVATGLSGHGFKLAPIFGQIATDLARGANPGYDISAFNPLRFSR